MLYQLCMIVDRNSVMWKFECTRFCPFCLAWDFGYVIRSLPHFLHNRPVSIFSGLTPCGIRRNATGSECVVQANWLLHMWTPYCRLRTPGLSLFAWWPTHRIWVHFDWHEFYPFWHIQICTLGSDPFRQVRWAPTRSGKPVLRFGCGRILHDQVLEFVRRLGHVFINM